ncbi:MAG: hypothetical protein AAF152_18160 [Cyanobacteria bacterium P01_A01_bin.114]
MTYAHPDDLPAVQLSRQDQIWHYQLETAAGKRFFETCSGSQQALLMTCQWKISSTAEALRLILHCPNGQIQQRILNYIKPLGGQLAQFSPRAVIRITTPDTVATPLEIRVDELTAYGRPT